MCDYSLVNVPNRLAEEGETLVVHVFPTGTKGLASPADLEPAEKPHGAFRLLCGLGMSSDVCAVCIPPGARLLLQRRLRIAVADVQGCHAERDEPPAEHTPRRELTAC